MARCAIPARGFSGVDTRPAASKNFVAYSLQRLGTDHIDVYRPARLAPAVPIEETVGALAEMVDRGWIRHIGLSEVGSETLRRASAVVHPVADLQIEYSLASHDVSSPSPSPRTGSCPAACSAGTGPWGTPPPPTSEV